MKVKRITALLLAVAICFSFAVTAAGYVDTNPNTHRNTGRHIVDLISVARTQLGYTELSTSTGMPLASTQSGGYTKYGASFGEPCGEWCAYFISWCASQAGIPSSVLARLGNCQAIINWYSGRSQFYYRTSGYIPKTGDLILYNWSGGTRGQHIGIVTGVSGNNVYTIEGNTGGTKGYRCEGKTRKLNGSYVVGYAVPKYNDADTYVGSYSFATSVSGGSASYSDSIAYTTSKLAVITTTASEITSDSAILNGGVTNSGRLFVSTAGFYFGENKDKLTKYPDTIAKNSETLKLSMNISEKFGKLKPKTTYYYRAYASIDGRDYLGPTYAVVTVSDVPTSIVLSETAISVGVGQTMEIMAAQLPVGSKNDGFTWTSENTEVATVTDGVVMGTGYGKVNVSATTNNGGLVASCLVNVLISTPQNIELVNTSKDTVTIKWDKVEGAKGYAVYRAESYGDDFKLIKKVNADKTSVTDKDVDEGERYYYRIRTLAADEKYDSDLSEIMYTTAKLSTVSNVKAAADGNTIKLTWDKVKDADKYRVYRATEFDGLYSVVDEVRANEFEDTELESGMYFYKIVAIDNDDIRTASEYSDIAAMPLESSAETEIPCEEAYIARRMTFDSYKLV